MRNSEYVLEAVNLTKTFPGVDLLERFCEQTVLEL